MEIYGNKSTFNFEAVLIKNVQNSDYYRAIQSCDNWSDLMDEIYENVDSVEPWLTGNARGPSSAFCCLHKLCELTITRRNISDTLSHPDSPYIRAVGFLYLRYVCNPKEILSWVLDYIDDPEEFKPCQYGPAVTMGAFVRDLLLSQYYFETIFPRIPVVVEREVKEVLQKMGLPQKAVGNGGTGGPDRRGVDEPNKRPPSVKAALSVAFGQTAPNRRGARDASFRTGAAGQEDKGKPSKDRGGSRDRAVDKPSPDRRGRDHKSSRDRSRSHSPRRDRERDYDRRDRGRDYDRRERDRRERDYDRRDRRDRHYKSRDYDRRDKDRGRDRGGSGRSRDRSRDRGGSRSRDARDSLSVFRDSASVFQESAAAPIDQSSLLSRYG